MFEVLKMTRHSGSRIMQIGRQVISLYISRRFYIHAMVGCTPPYGLYHLFGIDKVNLPEFPIRAVCFCAYGGIVNGCFWGEVKERS